MYLVCILIYVSMYLYSYPSTHRISRLAAGGVWEEFEVRLKMMMEWTQRYTPRPWSSEYGDALGGRDHVTAEMHSEAVIERVWRCTWRPRSSELRDALGDCDAASLEMHLEAMTERVGGGTCGDHDRVNLVMHSEAVIERVWRCTCRLWPSEMGGVLGGGRSGDDR